MPGHVLATFEFGSVNGGENSFLAVAGLLKQRGWRFSALVPPDSPLSRKLSSNDFPIIPFQRTNEASIRLDQSELRASIAAAIQTTGPDIVHCNSLSMSRLCGPVCRELNVPSLGYLRDIIKISRKAMQDINQIDQIIAVSEATRAFHVQHGLTPERSMTIHNGINREAFLNAATATGSIREELELPETSQLLLSCGQIGMRKGLNTLVEAFVELGSSEPNLGPSLHLLIIGQRHSQKLEAVEYEATLHDRIAECGLGNQIHFLGRRSDVAQIMQQSTLLVHAARQEPLGRVLLEAASVGLPIVATDVGGTSEILSIPMLKQCMVPPNEPSAIARAAQSLLENENLLKMLSQKLLEHAASAFSTDACANQVDAQYQRLISEKNTI